MIPGAGQLGLSLLGTGEELKPVKTGSHSNSPDILNLQGPVATTHKQYHSNHLSKYHSTYQIQQQQYFKQYSKIAYTNPPRCSF